jgi:hypothetical protein
MNRPHNSHAVPRPNAQNAYPLAGIRYSNQSPHTMTISLDDVPMSIELSLRRFVLNLTMQDVAQGCGMSQGDVQKAHATGIRMFPFIEEAQRRIAYYYIQLEMERGYR